MLVTLFLLNVINLAHVNSLVVQVQRCATTHEAAFETIENTKSNQIAINTNISYRNILVSMRTLDNEFDFLNFILL